MALASKANTMKSYNRLYEKIIFIENLFLAELKACKGKSSKFHVVEFEKNLEVNLKQLAKISTEEFLLFFPLF